MYCTDKKGILSRKIFLDLYFCRPYNDSMRKTGRPKTLPGLGKEEYLEVRLGAAEKKAFQDAAVASGMALSAWVRDRLRRASRKELEDLEKPVAFLERLSA